MRNVKILAALGLMTMAGIAQADVTGTAAIVSDYDFRGITQTNEDPAVQLSIDYAGAGGWYVGTWASNIDWLSDASTEVDVYTGFKGGETLTFDVGIVYYAYPGESTVNTYEVYGKLGFKWLTGSVYYTDDYYDSSEDEIYVAADAAIPVGPLSLGLHAGFTDSEAYAGGDYTDYGVGLSYTASNITLGMKWVTAEFEDFSDDRVILSISTALPWK